MRALDRFSYHRRRLRKTFGRAPISPEALRYIFRAASIEQVLETIKHEVLLGRKIDADQIRELRTQLGIALIEATIATQGNTQGKEPI